VAPPKHRAQAIEDLQKKPLRWDQLDNLKNKGGEPLLPR
jgi:ATP-independent RNA helicase DbpA